MRWNSDNNAAPGGQNSDSVVFIWTQRVLDRVGTLSARFTADKKIVILWGGEKIINKKSLSSQIKY